MVKSIMNDRDISKTTYGISEVMAEDICSMIKPLIQKRCELFIETIEKGVKHG